jgi:hypothetical protein
MTAKHGRMLQNQDSHLSALLQIYIHRGNQSFIDLNTGGLVPHWKAKSANMKEKRQPWKAKSGNMKEKQQGAHFPTSLKSEGGSGDDRKSETPI